ncbi:Rho guanine nucleotide exchange factor [Entamoeba marina]
MQKRDYILKEIVATEVSYLKSLETLQDVYYDDMTTRIPPKIPLDKVREMFLYLDNIISVSKELVELFETSTNNGSFATEIGNIFIQMLPYLKGYNMYVGNNAYALDIANKLYKKEKYADYLEQLRQSIDGPENAKLDLNSFLIMPVQRVPRYRLLLEDLFKNTPETQFNRASIEAAITAIKELAKSVDESIADEGRKRRLLEIKSKMPRELRESFVCSSRTLISESPVQLVIKDKSSDRTLVFVSDMLLFIVQKENKKMVVDLVIIIGKCKFHKDGRRFTISTKVDGEIVVIFNNEKLSDEFEINLTQRIKVEKDKFKNRKPSVDDCPLCRKSLTRMNSLYGKHGVVICPKCKTKVCKNCATTEIALFSGAMPRAVCDGCILAQFTQQQEAKTKQHQKKAPLQLKEHADPVHQTQSTYDTTQQQQMYGNNAQPMFYWGFNTNPQMNQQNWNSMTMSTMPSSNTNTNANPQFSMFASQRFPSTNITTSTPQSMTSSVQHFPTPSTPSSTYSMFPQTQQFPKPSQTSAQKLQSLNVPRRRGPK